MNADGSGQTSITSQVGFVGDRDPAWSPDGKRIAFVRGADTGAIHVMNADGSGQTTLTGSVGYGGGPTWAPNGNKIAFFTHALGEGQVYVMNADGSGQTNLTNHSSTNNGPSWQTLPSSGPTITSFAPASGPVGTSVTITGTNLSPFSSVTFGAVAAGVTSSSSSQIVATVPQGAATGPITVTTPSGSATSTTAFTVTGSGGGLEHLRSLTLSVGRKAKGRVTAEDGFDACGANVAVVVQHRQDGRWRRVGNDVTSDHGRFVVLGTGEPGRYRALARRVTLDAGDVCLKAVSAVVRTAGAT